MVNNINTIKWNLDNMRSNHVDLNIPPFTMLELDEYLEITTGEILAPMEGLNLGRSGAIKKGADYETL